MTIEYSPQDDYLRVTIGQPQESVAIAWPDEIYSVALVDPDSHLINAVEAPFFMEAIAQKATGSEFWGMIADLIRSGHTDVYIPPREERERTERALQGLVNA
jgi:hypothetical protein